MPYADVFRPSIALGLLHAILERADLDVESIHANFLFAEYVLEEFGLDAWRFVSQSRILELVGEWSFSKALFPSTEDDTKTFAALLQHRHWLYREYSQKRLMLYLTSIRRAAAAFASHLADEIIAKKPRIVGCSSTFQQHCPSLALLKTIKQRNPDIVTIMGGANCETIMGLTTHKHFPWVDFVVSGEGDDVIVPLTREIMKKGASLSPEAIPSGVFGPVHRPVNYPMSEKNGNTIPRSMAQDLDSLPPPNYDDYFRTLDTSKRLGKMVRATISVESSRGCWWADSGGCTFCGLNGYGNGYRSKTPEKVIRELAFLANRYHLENFEMSDNIMDRTYFTTLLPMLKKAGSPYKIFYETKSNLSKKQVKSLKEAGITWIQPGIESLSTLLLRHMNKGCMAWQNLRTLKWCRQYGIRVQWFILWDFPEEKDEWFMEMAHLLPDITHYQPPGNMLSILFNRYSLYHDRASDFGLKFDPAAPYFSIYPLPRDVIMDLAYFFEDKTRKEMKQNPILSKIIGREGVSALRKELAKWLIAFKSDRPPMLSMTYAGESIHIKDARPITSEATYELTGMAKDIYSACDNPCRLKVLKSKIVGNGDNTREFEETIDFLMRKRLVLLVDGRIMALALKAPVPALPEVYEWPGGLFTGELRQRPVKRDDC